MDDFLNPQRHSTLEGAPSPDWEKRLLALQHDARVAMEVLSQKLQQARLEPTSSADITADVSHALEAILQRQDSLEALLVEMRRQRSVEPSEPSRPSRGSSEPPDWAIELRAIITDRLDRFEAQWQPLSDSLASQNHRASVESDSVDHPDSAPAVEPLPVEVQDVSKEWLRVMLGSTLSDNQRFEERLDWLEDHLLAEDRDALLLMGQLLVFRFASTDRKPTLLKDVGEAYYRCFHKRRDVRDLFEEELVNWLQLQCEASGLPNTIEIVHPGDRFDASKHSPIERGGVEIAEVLGWVVLRDGGRVFSKALVLNR